MKKRSFYPQPDLHSKQSADYHHLCLLRKISWTNPLCLAARSDHISLWTYILTCSSKKVSSSSFENLRSQELMKILKLAKKQKAMVIGITLSCGSVVTVSQPSVLAEMFAVVSIYTQEASDIFGTGLSSTWPILYLNCLFPTSLWNHSLQVYICIDRTQWVIRIVIKCQNVNYDIQLQCTVKGQSIPPNSISGQSKSSDVKFHWDFGKLNSLLYTMSVFWLVYWTCVSAYLCVRALFTAGDRFYSHW